MSWPYAIIMFGAIYPKQLLWHFKYILQPRTKASRPDETRFNWRALPLPSLKRILSLALWPEYQFGKTMSSCGCYFSTTSMTPVYRRDCRKKGGQARGTISTAQYWVGNRMTWTWDSGKHLPISMLTSMGLELMQQGQWYLTLFSSYPWSCCFS